MLFGPELSVLGQLGDNSDSSRWHSERTGGPAARGGSGQLAGAKDKLFC